MVVKFWGTRGSIPVPGKKTLIFGGNTPCIQVTTEKKQIIVLDAGTGIRELGKELIAGENREIYLLISHSHWDHVHGIPFFLPLFRNDFKVNIYSCGDNGFDAESIIDAQMQPSFFPVNKEVFNANVTYNSITSGKTYNIAGVTIETLKVNHSKGTLSFKITENGKSVVYMTDNEIKFDFTEQIINTDRLRALNSELIEFCNGCEYLIHDSMYNLESFSEKIGWGHSNNVSLAYFSILAKVKNLVLFHYDPDYSDDIVKKMFNGTKRILMECNNQINCIASKEGLEIVF